MSPQVSPDQLCGCACANAQCHAHHVALSMCAVCTCPRPTGLLYFGGSDPSGVRPADQLVQINTEAELEAVK